METESLGAGTYPSFPEKDDFKCFEFVANISLIGYGYVYAKSEEEAKRLVNLGSWEELEKKEIERIEEITSIKEADR